jgi:hypothetical protein
MNTSARDLAFLINPISGGGVGKEVFQHLGEILDSFALKRETWSAEFTDPDRLTAQIDGFLIGSKKLLVVGGDGTMGMVLDRMRRLRPTAAIGLIPLGTGNDLGRALGIYRVYSAKGLIACLKRLLKAPAHSFDLWDVGGEATWCLISAPAWMPRCCDPLTKRGKREDCAGEPWATNCITCPPFSRTWVTGFLREPRPVWKPRTEPPRIWHWEGAWPC